MGVRKTNIIDKVKSCLIFMKHEDTKEMGIIQCNNCDSIKIKIAGSISDGMVSTSNYECLKCGATCKEIQTWKLNK